MTILHIDFETRSTVDLKAAGLDNYAKHSTTDVWCMAWAVGDGEVNLWHPGLSANTLAQVGLALREGLPVIAHNAAFELAIWNNVMAPRYGWPPLKPEQCRCTMAMAYAMALPGSLDGAAAAVGIKQQKDMAGHRLMLQMCKPREVKPDGTIVWWDDPEKLQKLYAYCKQDVIVERELEKRLMALSADEQALYVLDQKINNRGVAVDLPAVNAAIKVVQAEADRLNREIRDATDDYVGFCTETARISKWINSRGVAMPGIAKADVLDALADGDLPADVRRTLTIRQEAGKTSTAKLRAMIEATSADGRLRNMFQYHGAGTGRWAGRRVQLQNLVRWPDDFHIEDAEDCIARLLRSPASAADYFRIFHGSPLTVVSYLLRPVLMAAPGKTMFVRDFSNIEGRGLAWLAGEETKLQAFRDFDTYVLDDAGRRIPDGKGDFLRVGPDIYKKTAAEILRKTVAEVTGQDRQTFGKVPELACGFGGGVGAFQSMAKVYFVKVPDEQAEQIKEKWRDAHPKIAGVKDEYGRRAGGYWQALEEAAMQAVLQPGATFSAGPADRAVRYRMNGSFLWCRLPNGRVLCYPYPKVLPVETAWGSVKDSLTYMTVMDEQARKKGKAIPDPQAKGDWQRVSTYGGKHSENVTQAFCRDILVEKMRKAEAAGYPVIMHTHDELVAEINDGAGDADEFTKLCSGEPAFAPGLPVVAAGWEGKRYRK